MTPETIAIFFISLVLLWLKPGPGQALRLTYALQYGALSAFLISLGVITICLGYYLVVALGYSAIPKDAQWLFVSLKILGALYFIYLGAKGLLKLKKAGDKPQVSRTHRKNSALKDYSLGLLMASSNPIPMFYFLGILPTLVPLAEMTLKDIALGGVILISAGAIVDGLLITLTVLAREAFINPKTSKLISLITNVCFVIIGFYLLYAAIFLPDGIQYSII